MEQAIRFGSPFLLEQPWQLVVFVMVPVVLAALGARLAQGSALRIVGASLGAALRDVVLLALVASQRWQPCNPHYDMYAGTLLAFCVASGAALGAVAGPYKGWRLWFWAGLGALSGHWAYGYLPLVVWTCWRVQQRRRPQGQPHL